MSFLSRGTRTAARPLRQTVTQQQRRSASDHSHDSHGHGSGESAYHVTGGSPTGNESFGKGFYLALLFVPAAYLTYNLASTEDNFLKRSYRGYRDGLSKKKSQDAVAMTALEQAISDRSALFSEPREATRELRYPEMFNHGSPWNVAAGEGTADMRKLQSYYEQQRKEIDESRAARASK